MRKFSKEISYIYLETVNQTYNNCIVGIVITALLEFEVTAIGWYLVLYGTATLVFYSVSTKFWLKWAVRYVLTNLRIN